ncbi:DUF3568 family protein [Candidatus Entotheonella palauensis]|uniref:DUF3568 family protein n=1 Tax=Candidatus Entotheonella gemina TaxID=1429439 RepID=W4LZU2_9BACT|nr:DUF3568 family protein [Candidatus Entotheonella palauensis]ETX02902.1 MAG: hypothetical protein ETSY2_34540 [Candidatus Entotheonella gemina]
MKCLLPFVLALLVIFSGGCVPATIGSGDGAGVGVFSHITRDVQATYNVSMETAWPATLKAMEALDLRVESEHIDALGGGLAVKRANGTDIKINLKPLHESSTRIRVRVGRIGNKTKSILIHDAIRNALSI